MYGIINKAVKNLAIESGGDIAWEKIRRQAGCTTSDFMLSQSYDDSVTYDLVARCKRCIEHAARPNIKTIWATLDFLHWQSWLLIDHEHVRHEPSRIYHQPEQLTFTYFFDHARS